MVTLASHVALPFSLKASSGWLSNTSVRQPAFILNDALVRGFAGPSYIGAGNNDYALITDFNKAEDVIELSRYEITLLRSSTVSQLVEYSLGASPSGLPQGTGIYINSHLAPGNRDVKSKTTYKRHHLCKFK